MAYGSLEDHATLVQLEERRTCNADVVSSILTGSNGENMVTVGNKKNNIKNFLAGRKLEDIAAELGVSRQSIYWYVTGRNKPHELRMIDFLTILGEPWGRVLTYQEVWPE